MFREIKPQEIQDNPFELIGKEWLLVAANKDDRDSPTALHEDLSGSDRDVFPWYFPGNTAGDVKLHGNGIWKDRG